MSTNNFDQNYDNDQLFTDFLQDSIKDWEVGIVLCSYKKTSHADLERLICRFSSELDKKLGKVTRSMHSQHSQRVRKAIMLEHTKKKRYWHANAVLRRPKKYSMAKFLAMLKVIWLNILEKDFNRKISSNNDLYWGEEIEGGFRHYAFKSQPSDEKFEWQKRSGHEPTHFASLTLDNSVTH